MKKHCDLYICEIIYTLANVGKIFDIFLVGVVCA